MIISVVNQTRGEVSNAEMQRVIRAINRQISEDFEPYWSIGAVLRLEGKGSSKPGKLSLADLRGDAVIYVVDKIKKSHSEGEHALATKGIPVGYVFLDISKKLKEPWSITLSHEALELIGDPEVNLLVQGPHPDPRQKGRIVFHWYEMSDAVQCESYEIDGVTVSNFLLPLYFTGGDEYNGRNDFLGTVHGGNRTLKSFGVNPGGYVGFYDPKLGKDVTFYYGDDKISEERARIKAEMKLARRAIRYQRFREGNK